MDVSNTSDKTAAPFAPCCGRRGVIRSPEESSGNSESTNRRARAREPPCKYCSQAQLFHVHPADLPQRLEIRLVRSRVKIRRLCSELLPVMHSSLTRAGGSGVEQRRRLRGSVHPSGGIFYLLLFARLGELPKGPYS